MEANIVQKPYTHVICSNKMKTNIYISSSKTRTHTDMLCDVERVTAEKGTD